MLLIPSISLAQTYTWPVNGHTYQMLSSNPWGTARTAALGQGGDLVTINNQAEQDMLADIFGDSVNNPATYTSEFWIGYYDVLNGNNPLLWQWASGQTDSFGFVMPWNSGEPNNSGGSEDYAVFQSWNGATWNDYNGALTIPALMETSCSPTVSFYLQNDTVTEARTLNEKTIIYAGYDVDPDPGATTGNYEVVSGGNVKLYSEESIVLEEGFGVHSGGFFTAAVVSSVNCS